MVYMIKKAIKTSEGKKVFSVCLIYRHSHATSSTSSKKYRPAQYHSTLKMEVTCFPKGWYLCAKLHDVTFQKTLILILTAVGYLHVSSINPMNLARPDSAGRTIHVSFCKHRLKDGTLKTRILDAQWFI
jgi:hypothetical protein